MITTTGHEIRLTDAHRHKYDSAIAEWCDMHLDHADSDGGDVECPTGWFARFGRRVLVTDSRGFVTVVTYDDVRGAQRIVEGLERYWYVWSDDGSDDDDDDRTEDERDAYRTEQLALADGWLRHIAQNETNNLESYDYDVWVARGQPAGYLGDTTALIDNSPATVAARREMFQSFGWPTT